MTYSCYKVLGLAMGPDGSLYVSDSEKGKIWRIMFKGDRNHFGEAQLAEMERRKFTAPNIKTPHEENDILLSQRLKEEFLTEEAKLYNTFCSVCHQIDGKGNDRFPPLDGSEWVTGDKTKLIGVIFNGLRDEITVKGKSYNNAMPPLGNLTDKQISDILTYIRKSFGNSSGAVTPDEVADVRKIYASG